MPLHLIFVTPTKTNTKKTKRQTEKRKCGERSKYLLLSVGTFPLLSHFGSLFADDIAICGGRRSVRLEKISILLAPQLQYCILVQLRLAARLGSRRSLSVVPRRTTRQLLFLLPFFLIIYSLPLLFRYSFCLIYCPSPSIPSIPLSLNHILDYRHAPFRPRL